jgi:hypothetical protein
MNRFTDFTVRTAPADVSAHRFIDVRIRRVGFSREKRSSRHDLTRLAVAALRHIQL